MGNELPLSEPMQLIWAAESAYLEQMCNTFIRSIDRVRSGYPPGFSKEQMKSDDVVPNGLRLHPNIPRCI
jgi:hypothetical protein